MTEVLEVPEQVEQHEIEQPVVEIPTKTKLSPEERSAAAKARWARKKAKAAKEAKKAVKTPVAPKKPLPKEFRGASSYAEKRLAEAIKERAEAMGKVAMLNAEIPSLVQIIKALGSTHAVAQEFVASMPANLDPSNYNAPPPGNGTTGIRVPVIQTEAPNPRAMGGIVDVSFPEEND